MQKLVTELDALNASLENADADMKRSTMKHFIQARVEYVQARNLVRRIVSDIIMYT